MLTWPAPSSRSRERRQVDCYTILRGKNVLSQHASVSVVIRCRAAVPVCSDIAVGHVITRMRVYIRQSRYKYNATDGSCTSASSICASDIERLLCPMRRGASLVRLFILCTTCSNLQVAFLIRHAATPVWRANLQGPMKHATARTGHGRSRSGRPDSGAVGGGAISGGTTGSGAATRGAVGANSETASSGTTRCGAVGGGAGGGGAARHGAVGSKQRDCKQHGHGQGRELRAHRRESSQRRHQLRHDVIARVYFHLPQQKPRPAASAST